MKHEAASSTDYLYGSIDPKLSIYHNIFLNNYFKIITSYNYVTVV